MYLNYYGADDGQWVAYILLEHPGNIYNIYDWYVWIVVCALICRGKQRSQQVFILQWKRRVYVLEKRGKCI